MKGSRSESCERGTKTSNRTALPAIGRVYVEDAMGGPMPTLAIIWQRILSASFNSLWNWNQNFNLVCLGELLCEIPDFQVDHSVSGVEPARNGFLCNLEHLRGARAL